MFWLIIGLGFVIFLIAMIVMLRRSDANNAAYSEEDVERYRMAVAMEAFRSGKTCVGEVDSDGNLTIKQITTD